MCAELATLMAVPSSTQVMPAKLGQHRVLGRVGKGRTGQGEVEHGEGSMGPVEWCQDWDLLLILAAQIQEA